MEPRCRETGFAGRACENGASDSGAAFDVVEAGIQFPVVVVEVPADFRYSDEFFQRGCLRPQVSWGDHSKYIYKDGLLTVSNNLSAQLLA